MIALRQRAEFVETPDGTENDRQSSDLGVKFRISLFDCKTDNSPRQAERTWPQLRSKVLRPPIRAEKDDGALFSPAIFDPARRLLKNVIEVSLLVLDYDHDADFDRDLQAWRGLGCAFVAYSTFSHTEDSHHFRVIIPLAEPIPAAKFPRLWKWASQFSGGKIDAAASDASRMFYVPGRRSETSPYLHEIQDGDFLDWRKLDLPVIDLAPAVAARVASGDVPSKDVDALLRKAFAAKNGGSVFRLFQGDTSDYGGDDSRADQALCSKLAFWSGGNPRTLDQMFRGSRLFRDKWDARHGGDGRTYGEMTINKALQGRSEFYTNGNNGAASMKTDTPLDEPQDRSPKPPQLNRAALYGVIGDIVRTIEPHTEADPAAILVQLLAGFGNMIGSKPFFRVESDRHRPILFLATVGDTAKARKGVASGHARRVLARIDESWIVYNGLSSGEGLIHAVRDPQMRKEPIKEKGRIVGYQDVLSDEGVSDKRALVLEPEFASVLRVADRDGNTLSAIIRQAWDTGDLRVMTRNNPVRATGAHISLVGHITREELTRTLSQTEKANGFANRFCWLWVRRSKYLPEGGDLRDSDLNQFIAQLKIAFDFAREAGEVRRDAEATELWRSKYMGLSAGHPGMLGAITSRAEAQVVRLSLIYALLDCSALIRRPHLEAALALWQYCEDSARFIFGDAIGDRLADEILLALRDAAEVGMTRTQLRDLFKRNVDANRLNAALNCLAQNDLAEGRKEPGEGRPVERWFATEQRTVPPDVSTDDVVFEVELNG